MAHPIARNGAETSQNMPNRMKKVQKFQPPSPEKPAKKLTIAAKNKNH